MAREDPEFDAYEGLQGDTAGPYVGAYIVDSYTGELMQVVKILDGVGRELRVRTESGVERDIRIRPATPQEVASLRAEMKWCPACASWVKPVLRWVSADGESDENPDGWPEVPWSLCPNDSGTGALHVLTDAPPD